MYRFHGGKAQAYTRNRSYGIFYEYLIWADNRAGWQRVPWYILAGIAALIDAFRRHPFSPYRI